MRFKDKVVLVFGGNSGMGLAAAKALAAEGAKVHLTGRDQATIDAAVADIPGSRGYRSDIADVAATDEFHSHAQFLSCSLEFFQRLCVRWRFGVVRIVKNGEIEARGAFL